MSTVHGPSASQQSRRLILLLGSPRSGTSWLAKILDSYPGVWYSHEPTKGINSPELNAILDRVKSEGVGGKDREELRAALAGAQHGWMRHPFFPKAFQKVPVWMTTAAWGLVAVTGRGYKAFNRLASPRAGSPYDLLVKEVDWQGVMDKLMRSLEPQHLVVIIRHPCGVISSRLEGMRLGLMESHREGWVERNIERCQELGYSPAEVAAMSMEEFMALRWLAVNLEYLDLVKKHPSSNVVVYEQLCEQPLEVTRQLFTSLGWEMGKGTTDFIGATTQSGLKTLANRVLRRKRSYYALNKNPQEVVWAWRKKLTPQQQSQIFKVVEKFPHMDWWARGPAEGADGQPEAVLAKGQLGGPLGQDGTSGS